MFGFEKEAACGWDWRHSFSAKLSCQDTTESIFTVRREESWYSLWLPKQGTGKLLLDIIFIVTEFWNSYIIFFQLTADENYRPSLLKRSNTHYGKSRSKPVPQRVLMGSEGLALAAAGWSRQCVAGKALLCSADMGLNPVLNAEFMCELQHFLGLDFLIYKMGNLIPTVVWS